MTRFLILGGSGLFWAFMMASLFRTEVLPYFEYQAPPSYGDVLRPVKAAEITRGEIQAAGAKVGEIETVAERLFDGNNRLRSRATLKARVLGVGERSTDEIPIRLKSETMVDPLFRLQRTWCEIDLGFGVAVIQGIRNGEQLNVRLGLGPADRPFRTAASQTVDFPQEGMIGDLFQPFIGGGALFVGKKWKIPTMTADLTGPRLGWLYAAVTEREKIQWSGKLVDTFRVEIRTEPTEEKRPTHISWCRDDGIALRQQFTFQSLVYDIVFVSRDAWTLGEALAWGRKHFRRDD